MNTVTCNDNKPEAYSFANLEAVSYNSEAAEIGNPEGAWYAEVHYVAVESLNGARFVHNRFSSRDQAKADAFAAAVNKRLSEGRVLDPKCWTEIDPCYGSDSYISQGIEAHQAFAERNAGV